MVIHNRKKKKRKKNEHTHGGPVKKYILSAAELKKYKEG
jgi:hypothetical protein